MKFKEVSGVNTIYKYADSIVSPLGVTTAQNWSAMLEGRSGIECHRGVDGFPDSFWAAIFPDQLLSDCYTRFEQLLIVAAREALSSTGIDPASPEVVFIISSTKGNIDLIDPEKPHSYTDDRIYLWKSAEIVSSFFNNPHRPVVVSQACISGVSALLVGMNLLQQSCYKYAIVIGADVFSRFVYSGFHSLGALAPQRCRPFDSKRQGLNLGEAAACMVLGKEKKKGVTLRYGAATNDAFHLSAPSRTGEGLYCAMMKCLAQVDYIPDFINAHGTATIYNDQMEATALARAGLLHISITAFKGTFGHTLGAAGLIDVVISSRCLEEGTLLPVLGFKELGVMEPLNIQTEIERKELRTCLKTAAGFGGNNAALIIEK